MTGIPGAPSEAGSSSDAGGETPASSATPRPAGRPARRSRNGPRPVAGPSPAGPSQAGPVASLGERGYRRYDGTRLGEWAAVTSLWRHTMQRVLGLRRSARHKVLPFLTAVIAYLPAVAFIGILALIPDEADADPRSFVPDYGAYYGFVTAAIVLFVVFVAPEALCPDRRHRSLSLYLASPLTRDTYLLAKLLAVFSTLCIVTVGPVLLLLLGYTFQGVGPDGPLGVLSTLGRVVAAGALVAAFYTGFALCLASLTDRKGLATGASLIALLGSHAAGGILAFGFGLPRASALVSMMVTPFELAARLLSVDGAELALASVPTGTVAAAFVAWLTLFLFAVWARYATLRVTR